MKHIIQVAFQLALLWIFITLYVVTIVPLAVVIGVFGRREK